MKGFIPPKDDTCRICKSPIVRQASNMNNWACSNPKCELAHGPTWSNGAIEKLHHLRDAIFMRHGIINFEQMMRKK